MKQSPADSLQRYRALLERYHSTLDLLSDRGLAEADRLIAEADAYAEVIGKVAPAGRVVLDLGSGAGLPGIVLAVRLPGRKVILTERRRKRASFLTLVTGQLGLDNVEVVQGDVRAVKGLCADVVVAQAVADLSTVVRLTRHLMADEVVLVSRKGPEWRDELAALQLEMGAEGEGNDVQSGAGNGAQGEAAITVVAEEALGHRGTLVALRIAGGWACRSSG